MIAAALSLTPLQRDRCFDWRLLEQAGATALFQRYHEPNTVMTKTSDSDASDAARCFAHWRDGCTAHAASEYASGIPIKRHAA